MDNTKEMNSESDTGKMPVDDKIELTPATEKEIEEIYVRAARAIYEENFILDYDEMALFFRQFTEEILKYKIDFGFAYKMDKKYFNIGGGYWWTAHGYPAFGKKLDCSLWGCPDDSFYAGPHGLLTFHILDENPLVRSDFDHESDHDSGHESEHESDFEYDHDSDS
jgi:hypothetical protein